MSVQYEQAEGVDLLDKFKADHVKKLALEQAEENANDPEHIERVNEALGAVRRGDRNPVDVGELRRKLLG